MAYEKVQFCKNCYNNRTGIDAIRWSFYYYYNNKQEKCPKCNGNLIELNLSKDEFHILFKTSPDKDFIFAMDKLKADDIVEFNLKMSQFKQSIPKQKSDNKPKCPTCGSNNIKKISGTKRWLSTGVFGLASSNVGKTMQCNSCGYKW